ncbi:salicylate synthase [Streptomyces sp. NPDC048172]|uniref:salicylate synthase n=1 Tax=Streptomyces sp. NPDC048172 TaxID=3365505 RepID=UPI003716F8C9
MPAAPVSRPVPHAAFTGSPATAAARLARSGPYEQYVVYEREGTWWYAGGVAASVTVEAGSATLRHGGTEVVRAWRADPLSAVRELLAQLPMDRWRAYGWVAFEMAYALAGAAPGEHGPLLHLVVPEAEVALTHGGAEIRCCPDAATEQALRTTLAQPRTDPRTGPHRAVPVDLDPGHSGLSAYRSAVSQAVSAIQEGQLRKVILSRTVPVGAEIDLPATYLAGRAANSPARSFLLRLRGTEAAGFSPETVVEVTPEGRVSTQPLAGTRALTGDADGDAARRAELLADAKEVYEHAISVQVAWDELTALCRAGSVRAEEFMTVRERGSVQHLASRITGELRTHGEGPWAALAAVFPAVTASGVPKSAAYETIRRLEPDPRGLYSGAVLTVGHDGAMDAALVLRTVFRSGGRTWLRAGAGIVGDSRPEREFEETCEKLRSVSRTLVPAVETAS